MSKSNFTTGDTVEYKCAEFQRFIDGAYGMALCCHFSTKTISLILGTACSYKQWCEQNISF